MAEKSAIEWTEATFNPWWGCAKVSPGCDNCYAERDAARFYPHANLWGVGAPRRAFSDKHWNDPLRWNARAEKAGKRLRVFCASMADVFDKDAPAGERERLWALIEATPYLDWQILTKRIGNVPKMVPAEWMARLFPRNVWLGISVVNQEEADRDIPKLVTVPVCIRWLSCEPLLGRIDLCETFGVWWNQTTQRFEGHGTASRRDIEWVVVGGESGPHARPMHGEWARSIIRVCKAVGVPVLFKQWGEWLSFDAGSPCLRIPEDGSGVWAKVDGKEYRAHQILPTSGGWSVRVGRKVAGRMIDGVIHDEYPV